MTGIKNVSLKLLFLTFDFSKNTIFLNLKPNIWKPRLGSIYVRIFLIFLTIFTKKKKNNWKPRLGAIYVKVRLKAYSLT